MRYKGGYAGQVIEVDLTGGQINRKELSQELVENYLGGRGFTSRLQYDLIPPGVDPLGPENVLILATGPLTGTLAPASSRFVVGGRSPLTGILGDANCGGHWGPELKHAGYDAIIVRGRSPKNVYLWIDDDKMELRDATHLWGKTSIDTENLIREEMGDKSIRVASIGQGGENLVYFAGVVCDADHLAARTGMGAVMGSKNLKAIAVRGRRGLEIADISSFREAVKEIWDIIINDDRSGRALPEYGTTMLLDLHNSMGGLVTKNWQSGYFENADKIDGEACKEYALNAVGCFACPSRCDRYCVVNEGEFKGTRVGGPEYYTIATFGSKCGNDNLPSILKANELCNNYGLDTGTTGGIIAFAMECFERGILTTKDTDGLDLSWGNYKSIIELIHKIAHQEGFGRTLSSGFYEAVKQIGPESAKYAIHVKGMDPSTFDPRALKVYNFRYAVSTRGADHLRISTHGAYELEADNPLEATAKLKFWQDVVSIPDIMGVCKFPYTFFSETSDISLKKALELVPRLFEAATGLPLDSEKLMAVANRLALTERAHNNRLGYGAKEDVLPERFINEALPSGKSQGQKYDVFNELKEGFYAASGIDLETGFPKREAMEQAGLEEIAADLEKHGINLK